VTELGHLIGVGRATDSNDRLSTPSPEVWHRISAELGFTSAETARAEPERAGQPSAGEAAVMDLAARRQAGATASPGPTSRGRRPLALAVAAALALIAGVGIGSAWDRLRGDDEQTVATAPLEPLPGWTGARGEAQLRVDEDGHRYLVVNVTNPNPVSAPPQVWVRSVASPTEMINLGPFVSNGQRIQIDDAVDLRQFPLVDISDEPNADPAHSGVSIVQGLLST